MKGSALPRASASNVLGRDRHESPVKVLAVDDRSENLFTIQTTLKRLPVEVVTADSGEAALRATLRHEFAVVLLDVQMPGMDGFELAQFLRENEETRYLPIIFLTAISKEKRYLFRGYEAGAVDYLFKPLDLEILVSKVAVFAELHRGRVHLAQTVEKLKLEMDRRERIETELRLAQKLESIGQLAAGVAHEVNTPAQYVGDNLAFILESLQDLEEVFTATECLKKQADTVDGLAEARQALQRAEDSIQLKYLRSELPRAAEQAKEGVEHIAKIVRTMKSFSHVGQEEKVPSDLNEAIEATIAVSRNEWKFVAEMETELDPCLPMVPCVLSEINQVVLNLIVNAAHAVADVVGDGSSARGTICVTTSSLQDSVEIRVQDTGAGIPREVQERIFDPFFTTKEVGRGTGQGLAICRSVVVDRHNGSLEFETRKGEGTTFVVRLPLRDVQPTAILDGQPPEAL
ncbi:MAG: response regulator [Proteobacteria bacterium]|nr:response regulator [Pseudomonadota bacterium]